MHSFWHEILERSTGKPWQDKSDQLELPFKTSPIVQAPWSRDMIQVLKEEAK